MCVLCVCARAMQLPDCFTVSLRERVDHIVFTTNPCRIRFCANEIVVFRDNLLAKMRTRAVLQPSDADTNPTEHVSVAVPLCAPSVHLHA
jgi:hypothetical protein